MKRGFSLIEILLAILIIGILAAIAVPRVTYTAREARIQACNGNVAAMNSQIELYYLREEAWPNLNRLRSAGYIDAVPVCPFGRNYNINGTTHRVRKHTH